MVKHPAEAILFRGSNDLNQIKLVAGALRASRKYSNKWRRKAPRFSGFCLQTQDLCFPVTTPIRRPEAIWGDVCLTGTSAASHAVSSASEEVSISCRPPIQNCASSSWIRHRPRLAATPCGVSVAGRRKDKGGSGGGDHERIFSLSRAWSKAIPAMSVTRTLP